MILSVTERMSFIKRSPLEDKSGAVEQIQNPYLSTDESGSCEETVDGLSFGYLKKTFSGSKLVYYW